VKISGCGAAIGAFVGCVGRAVVVAINIPDGALFPFALPSAFIGLLVGGIAGAFGRPLLGAAVGAVLSGAAFELFMLSCASLIGAFSQTAKANFLSFTLLYGLEMAVAGAIAGGVGGLVGQLSRKNDAIDSAALPLHGERRGWHPPLSLPEPPARHFDSSEGIRRNDRPD
jgi:hypothetical protein